MVFIQFSTIRSFIILCQGLYIRQSQFRHNDFFCLILISNSSCNSRNHSNHLFLFKFTKTVFLRIYPFNGRATTFPIKKNLYLCR